MNTSSLCQFALILQTSSSVVESPARKTLETTADSDFFWLLISTAVVAVGIVFEYPEVKHEFTEWLRSRKNPWVIDPSPVHRSRVPLWSLIGFLVVIIGVAGEGVYEGLLGINDTKIRKIDEAALASDELQIAKLEKENLLLQKQAGDAATSAHNAAVDAKSARDESGQAKVLASGAREEANSFERDIVSAKNSAADANNKAATAESHLASALEAAASAQAEVIRIKTPRSLINTDKIVSDLKAFTGTEYLVETNADDEQIQFTKEIAAVLERSGWIRKQPKQVPLNSLFFPLSISSPAEGIPLCIATGVTVLVHIDTPSAFVGRDVKYAPAPARAAIALQETLVENISPRDVKNVPAVGIIAIDPKPGVGPAEICIGKKP